MVHRWRATSNLGTNLKEDLVIASPFWKASARAVFFFWRPSASRAPRRERRRGDGGGSTQMEPHFPRPRTRDHTPGRLSRAHAHARDSRGRTLREQGLPMETLHPKKKRSVRVGSEGGPMERGSRCARLAERGAGKSPWGLGAPIRARTRTIRSPKP